MLARHAESLFWAGRYIERAEDTARMLDVAYHGVLESTRHEADPVWWSLLEVLNLDAEFRQRGIGVSAASISRYLVLDATNDGSISEAVERARENLRSVRELIPTELWEAINTFHLDLRGRDLDRDLEQQPYVLYHLVRLHCQTVAGVALETMLREDGWRFLQIGWALERAQITCRLLDVWARSVDADDAGVDRWDLVLRSASASEAYRKIYGATLEPTSVIAFLLLSPTFPRSVLFAVTRAEASLNRLRSTERGVTRPERLLGRVRADLEFAELREVTGDGLHDILDRLQHAIRQAAEAVALQYFRSHSELPITALEFHPIG